AVSKASGTLFSTMLSLKTSFLALILSGLMAPGVLGQDRSNANGDTVLMRTLQQELDRAMTSLSKPEPAPHFISYAANHESANVIAARRGAIIASTKRRARSVDISVRVGSRELDNTHGENRGHGIAAAALPVEDKSDAIARVLWLNTDRMYKRAAQSYLEVKTRTKVRAEEEDSSPDFSSEKPAVDIGKATLPPQIEQKAWEDRIRRYSSIFAKYPDVAPS